jgi:hypothetical protein
VFDCGRIDDAIEKQIAYLKLITTLAEVDGLGRAGGGEKRDELLRGVGGLLVMAANVWDCAGVCLDFLSPLMGIYYKLQLVRRRPQEAWWSVFPLSDWLNCHWASRLSLKWPRGGALPAPGDHDGRSVAGMDLQRMVLRASSVRFVDRATQSVNQPTNCLPTTVN